MHNPTFPPVHPSGNAEYSLRTASEFQLQPSRKSSRKQKSKDYLTKGSIDEKFSSSSSSYTSYSIPSKSNSQYNADRVRQGKPAVKILSPSQYDNLKKKKKRTSPKKFS